MKKRILTFTVVLMILLSSLTVFAVASPADQYGALADIIRENGEPDGSGGYIISQDDFDLGISFSFACTAQNDISIKLSATHDFYYNYTYNVNDNSWMLIGDTAEMSGTVAADETMSDIATVGDFTGDSDAYDELAETAATLRTASVTIIQFVNMTYATGYAFSDYGINHLFFCETAHDFGQWLFFNDSTETEDGTERRSCVACGHYESRTAVGTAGIVTGDTAFDKLVRYLAIRFPDCGMIQTEFEADEGTASLEFYYDIDTDELALDFSVVGDDMSIFYNIYFSRDLNTDHRVYIEVTEADMYSLGVGTLPEHYNGDYRIVYAENGVDNAVVEEIVSAISRESIALIDLLFLMMPGELTLSDMNISDDFICPDGNHTVEYYLYNGDATADSDGTRTGICDECSREITVTAFGTKLVTIKNTASIFRDVKDGEWYKDAVDYAYSHGFVLGMSNTEFGVDTKITRGMFITVLARMAGVDTSNQANNVNTKFTDVQSGRYYTAAIKWASENEVVSGMSETTFQPESYISRQQLCVMLSNFAKQQGIYIYDQEDMMNFADNASIAHWAADAVAECQMADIINGYNEGGKLYFKPDNTATRSEASQILYKFHETFIME